MDAYRDRFGVYYLGLGTGWLCDACGNAKPSVHGGRTCMVDSVRIAMTRACRDWEVDPWEPMSRAFLNVSRPVA